jgi:uncharacterized protein YndB with AHSA1/START domain
MNTTATDRIEKTVMLRAPRSRVWRALVNADEFGSWFGVTLEGPFTEGAAVRGRITHPGYDHLTLEVLVDRIEPEHRFSYRWHPYAVDPAVDGRLERTAFRHRPKTLRDEQLDLQLFTAGEPGGAADPPIVS